MTIKKKATGHYFSMALLFLLYKVVKTFESVNEINVIPNP